MFCKAEKCNLKCFFFGSDERKLKGREAGSAEYFFVISLLFNSSDGDLFVLLPYIIWFFCKLSFVLYFGDLSLKYFLFDSQIFKNSFFQIFKFMQTCQVWREKNCSERYCNCEAWNVIKDRLQHMCIYPCFYAEGNTKRWDWESPYSLHPPFCFSNLVPNFQKLGRREVWGLNKT